MTTSEKERDVDNVLPQDDEPASGDLSSTTGDAGQTNGLAHDGPPPAEDDSAAPDDGDDEYQALLDKANERDLFLDELRRARADFENYQKRVRREKLTWESRAVRVVLVDFLSIRDNLERALADDGQGSLESFREGVVMIQQHLEKFLQQHNTREVAALGEPFDPAVHEAVYQVPTERPEEDGVVLEVIQSGFRHGDVVIRPARVAVGKKQVCAPHGAPAEEAATSPEEAATSAEEAATSAEEGTEAPAE